MPPRQPWETEVPDEEGYGWKAKLGLGLGGILAVGAIAAYALGLNVANLAYRLAVSAPPVERLGKTIVAEGAAYRKAGGRGPLAAVSVGQEVSSGDVVLLGEEVALIIQFTDGGMFELAPRSQARLDYEVELAWGNLFHSGMPFVKRRPVARVLDGRFPAEELAPLEAERAALARVLADAAAKNAPPTPLSATQEWRPAPPPVRTPKLTHPKDGAVFTPEELEEFGNTVIFTWSVVKPGESYTLELARDPRFKDIALSKKSPRNTLPLRGLPKGNFFWQVRSSGGETSNAHRLTVR